MGDVKFNHQEQSEYLREHWAEILAAISPLDRLMPNLDIMFEAIFLAGAWSAVNIVHRKPICIYRLAKEANVRMIQLEEHMEGLHL